MQQPNSSTDDQCWHVIRWVNSTRSVPALKRCFRSRSTANTIRRRGIVGDRSSDHLNPHDPEQNPLGVIQCDPSRCDCMRWPSGHNAASIPEKPQRRLLVCEFCHKARRNAVELVDPRTEEPEILCPRCAERRALALAFRNRLPLVRRIHADDGRLVFLTVWG